METVLAEVLEIRQNQKGLEEKMDKIMSMLDKNSSKSPINSQK